jgi:3-phosphoshikimate 1-carboxyvinyltransferase
VGQSFASTLTMAPAFAPMEPLAKALRWRGGLIEGVFLPEAPGRILPPLTVGPLPGGVHLSELEFEIGPMESDVKGAALLSGLYSDGATYLREPLVSCDHAERRLQALDVPVATAGSLVELEPAQWSAQLPTVSHRAVGDAGAAALLLVAAALVPESQVSARDAGLNPTRGGALSFLRRMGGQFAGEVHAHIFGEPAGIASSAWAPLRATAIDGEDALRAADDIGVLAALAARAEGVSTIAAPTLSEGKIEALAAVLRSFGVDVETSAAGFTVEGRPNGRLRAAEVDAGDEVDLATLSVLLGLVANGPSRVRRVDGLARRFPRIVGTLRALGADLRVSAASEAT